MIPDIPCTARDMIVTRIRQVEDKLTAAIHVPIPNHTAPAMPPLSPMTHFPPQAPSTLAALAKSNLTVDAKGHIVSQDYQLPIVVPPPAAAPEPVAVIAQTPAAAAAVQSRQASIEAALSGKVDKIAGRPKKW